MGPICGGSRPPWPKLGGLGSPLVGLGRRLEPSWKHVGSKWGVLGIKLGGSEPSWLQIGESWVLLDCKFQVLDVMLAPSGGFWRSCLFQVEILVFDLWLKLRAGGHVWFDFGVLEVSFSLLEVLGVMLLIGCHVALR